MFIDKFIFQKHLEEGEEILYTVHKHWSLFLGPLVRVLFFGFALPCIVYLSGFRTTFSIILITGWMALAFIRLIYDWIDWYSDLWLFTSMSVIVVEWHGIFSNTSRRIGYEDAEGISFIVRGFWGTVLRYGDVQLSVLSGAHEALPNARQPKKAELAFMRCQGDYLSQRNFAHSNGLKEILSQMVAQHLRRKK